MPPLAKFLKLSLTVLLFGAVAALIVMRVVAPQQPLSSVGPLVMLTVAGIGRLLLWRGYIVPAATVAVFGFWSALLMVVLMTGGLRSPVVAGFPVVILTVGWLISTRAALLITAMTICATLGLWLIDKQQWMPLTVPAPAVAYASDQIIFYAISAVLAVFFRQAYRRRLRDLGQVSATLSRRTRELEQRTAELQRAQSVAKIGSWSYQIVSDTLQLSTATCRIMQIEPGSVTSFVDYVQRFHPDDRDHVMLAWQATLTGAPFDEEHRILINDSTRWIRQIAEMAHTPEGAPEIIFGTMQDITERKRTQLALADSEERYRVMTEWSPESILVHRQGVIVYANPAALQLFGAEVPADLLGRPTSDLIQPDFMDTETENMYSVSHEDGVSKRLEARFLKLDGTPFEVEMQGTSIQYDGAPATHVALRDITERKHMESIIRHQALYDALTQLPNRRLLEDRLGQTLSSNRRSSLHSALMFMDLDNFKPLNDQHGHAVGDLLLIETADRLLHCVREADTVARFGGDEFVVLLADLSVNRQESAAYSEAVAAKILAAMANPFVLHVQNGMLPDRQVEHRCSVSIGIVVFNGEPVSEGDLIKWADAAMYRAKEAGRARACMSDMLDTEAA